MASHSEWGPFLNYWGHYCKDAFGQAIGAVGIKFQFSEGLLKSLYYETDVGSIPRGINFHKTTSTPQYADSKNWKYPIHDCYWCVEKVKTADFLGIFCSRECLVYFHDWCIERVEFFTNKRFCRLLGCDKILHNRDKPYCSGSDEGKFDAAFSQFSDYQKLFKSVIRSGPNWYDKAISIDMKYNRAKYNLEFPEQFTTELIYNTDVGVIPRGRIIQKHLTSKYYNSSNWSAEIKGCYNCDNRNVSKFYNEMFCKERCQLVFYEWCRKKIERETTIRFCQLPGCPKLASEGFECCNREHSNQIEQKYTEAKIDIKRLSSSMSPTWYNRSVTPFESIPPMNQQPSTTNTQISHSHPPIQLSTEINPQFQSSSSCFIFSRQLTEFLYFQTDVGPIPREIQPFMTSPPPPVNQNWTVPITQCYWCCTRPRTVYNIACSNECFFLFNEWLHNKFTDISNKRLCRVLSCERNASGSFKCCNRDHSVQFESSFKKYFSLLKETDFVLGPSWYADYSRNRIEFYNLEAPFYEFTNFYPCRNLFIGNIKWKTSEHYFQASKFAGTPYFNCVSTLPSPRDAFKFSRERNVQRWIHPNWQSIKLTVMRRVLVEKFSQDETLLKILLKTGNAQLVEHTKNDRFWGDGGDGSGENHLGRLLVLVRDQLRDIFPNITPQYNPQQTSVHTPYLDQSSSINNSTSSSPFNVYNVPLNPECLPMQLSAPSWEPDSTIAKTNAISEPMEVGYNESTNLKEKHSLNLAQTKAEKDYIPESDQTLNADTSHLESNSGHSKQDYSYGVSSTTEQELESNRNSIQATGSDPNQGTNTSIVPGEAKHQLRDDYVCPFNNTESLIGEGDI